MGRVHLERRRQPRRPPPGLRRQIRSRRLTEGLGRERKASGDIRASPQASLGREKALSEPLRRRRVPPRSQSQRLRLRPNQPPRPRLLLQSLRRRMPTPGCRHQIRSRPTMDRRSRTRQHGRGLGQRMPWHLTMLPQHYWTQLGTPSKPRPCGSRLRRRNGEGRTEEEAGVCQPEAGAPPERPCGDRRRTGAPGQPPDAGEGAGRLRGVSGAV